METQDKTFTCKICDQEFTFTIGEQIFFKDRCLEEPRRCPKCRARKKAILHEDIDNDK